MTVIATAGHVDHGKSTLIKAICGTDPDRLAEEQRRGMTIELGFAHQELNDGTVLSFVDVPGHVDFVRTMVSGASAADVALLVVDAGEGWMPQTQEHVDILGLLGVPRGVVAITKSDRVPQETINGVVADVAQRLTSTPIEWTSIIPVSSSTGAGLQELTSQLANVVKHSPAPVGDWRVRLFIDRVFSMRGAGTVVTGTLLNGSVSVNDELVIARTGEKVRVRSVQTHGQEVTTGHVKSRVALNLANVERDTLRRGDALTDAIGWHMATVCDARFRVLESARPLTRRDGHSLHIGTSTQLASTRVIGTDSISAGEEGLIRLRWTEPVPLSPGDRFLLRDPGTGATLGGGTVLDVDPRERISRAHPGDSIESRLQGRGWCDVDTARRLTGEHVNPVVGTWFATTDVVEHTRAALLKASHNGTLDIATLTDPERAMLEQLGVTLSHGRVVDNQDPLESHPYSSLLRNGGTTPGPSAGLDRDVIRRMVQVGIIFEHDGIAFHRDVLNGLRDELRMLWQVNPNGFSVSQLRERLGITRKHAVPLAECLDRCGLTTRRGDSRLPGPRF